MIVQIGEQWRVRSNSCGGFDLEFRGRDKKTGELRSKKDGTPDWKFAEYHPSMLPLCKSLLSKGIESDDLTDLRAIQAALELSTRQIMAALAGRTQADWAAGRMGD